MISDCFSISRFVSSWSFAFRFLSTPFAMPFKLWQATTITQYITYSNMSRMSQPIKAHFINVSHESTYAYGIYLYVWCVWEPTSDSLGFYFGKHVRQLCPSSTNFCLIMHQTTESTATTTTTLIESVRWIRWGPIETIMVIRRNWKTVVVWLIQTEIELMEEVFL